MTASVEDTKRVMGVLAHCNADELDSRFGAIGRVPAWQFIRKPETGLVMLRGRISGSGSPFNAGEATVTRAVVALDTGETGYSYALGRDRRKAEQSAIIHALWQSDAWRKRIEADVIEPLDALNEARDQQTRDEVAPTKVEFYTLVRGDD